MSYFYTYVLRSVKDSKFYVGFTKDLLKRLETEEIKEIILALNPDTEGETTALYLAKLLKPLNMRVSRIARGLPIGGDLEFADEATIGRAVLGRIEI